MKRQEGEQLVRELKAKGVIKNPGTLSLLTQKLTEYLSEQVKKSASPPSSGLLLF